MSTFLFNFQRQFAARVEQGEKRQTIRGRRADGRRPQPGDQVKLYTGLRTRHARLLCQAAVVRCRAVRIDFAANDGNGEMVIDGELLQLEHRQTFAAADGFDCWQAMLAWFKDQYGSQGSSWDGFCVEW